MKHERQRLTDEYAEGIRGFKMAEKECVARTPRALLLVVLALVVLSSEGPSSAASAAAGAAKISAQSDEAAVRALATRMTEAWNKGDASGFAAEFVEDGELISGTGTRSVGRREIEQYIARILMNSIRFSSAVIGVRFIHPDVAVWTSDGGFMRPGETQIGPDERGIQSLVA